jgi:hypothetical protein
MVHCFPGNGRVRYGPPIAWIPGNLEHGRRRVGEHGIPPEAVAGPADLQDQLRLDRLAAPGDEQDRELAVKKRF